MCDEVYGGEHAHRQARKEGFVLPAEAARRHIPATDRRHDIDARFRRLLEVCGEFVALGDITHLAVLRAFYGRVFALGYARDNAPYRNDLFLLIDIAPA